MSIGISSRSRGSASLGDRAHPNGNQAMAGRFFQFDHAGQLADGVEGERGRGAASTFHSAMSRSVGTPALSRSVRSPYMFST